jgi:hypothetical protein
MNCSALNAHLFIRNLVESPNCICEITETISHFLAIPNYGWEVVSHSMLSPYIYKILLMLIVEGLIPGVKGGNCAHLQYQVSQTG